MENFSENRNLENFRNRDFRRKFRFFDFRKFFDENLDFSKNVEIFLKVADIFLKLVFDQKFSIFFDDLFFKPL